MVTMKMKSAQHGVDQADDEAKEECWNLPADFDLYTKHEIKHVYFPRRKCEGSQSSSFFRIECINPNSPLDISNNGTSSSLYDATGHCVWAGGFLLIQCIYELQNILNEDIGGKRMIEFGCGTGIGGLAMLLANEVGDKNDAPIIPSHVTFTDNDPSALRICDRNCNLNSIRESLYSVSELTWGDEVDTDSALFDVGLATDALYDEKMIIPLFKTVSRCVIPGGVFILSHIPRACFEEDSPPEAVENLEKYIIDMAAEFDLDMEEILRSSLTSEENGTTPASIDSRQIPSFSGGGIIIFRKKSLPT